MPSQVQITITDARGGRETISTAPGETLRAVLLRHSRSPYRGRFKQLNCKGLGVCGSCKVLVHENGELWSRRSCQIRCFHDLQIELE